MISPVVEKKHKPLVICLFIFNFAGFSSFQMMKIRDKKKEDEVAQFQQEVELLLWLVKLFNADPMLALHVCNSYSIHA